MCFLSFVARDLSKICQQTEHSLRFHDCRWLIAPDRLQWHAYPGTYIWDRYLTIGGQAWTSTAYKPWSSKQLVVIKSVNASKDRKWDKEHGGFSKRVRWLKTTLIKEAKLISTLDHENVIKLIDWYEVPEECADEPGGDVLQIMELYNGDILNLLEKEFISALSQEDLVRSVASQMSKALDYCHNQKGIIHRDVKPMNILWKFRGNARDHQKLHFVLADFGMAKDFPGKLNPRYCARAYYWYPPEYYTYPSKQEPRGDVWMLALTLLWIVDEDSLRTQDHGELELTTVWDRVAFAAKSKRWQAWAGMLERDVNHRMGSKRLSALASRTDIGPDLSNAVRRQDPADDPGAWPRDTFSPPHRGFSPAFRCWHSELRSPDYLPACVQQECQHCGNQDDSTKIEEGGEEDEVSSAGSTQYEDSAMEEQLIASNGKPVDHHRSLISEVKSECFAV